MDYKTYEDALTANKDVLKYRLIKIIDNKTMAKSYSFYSNLHMDFGISDTWLHSGSFSKKSLVNKRLQLIKTVTNKKLKLVKTDNDSSYTRLIYEI